MRNLLGWVVVGFASCLPATPLSCASSRSAPVEPGVQLDSGCAVLDAITDARLIRTDSGAPLVIHCVDGGMP